MKSILYLHGFHSSPYSQKTLEFKRQIEISRPDINVIAPQLPPLPNDAIVMVNELVQQHQATLIGVVGSSMGGYLSTYLHNEFNLPAVVINPAVKPFELLKHYLGEQVHPITNQSYELQLEHMESLKSIYAEKLRTPSNVWLLQQEGDEVLDFKQAISHYQDAIITCEPDGSHSFDDFERFPLRIVEFLEQASCTNSKRTIN